MSLEKFITNILNIDESRIKSIESITSSDKQQINVYIKLNEDKDVKCPYCKEKPLVHGYYRKKLIHSTLANRKCYIFYDQRRYKCKNCDITFHENNPFASENESLTYETKINILKDLKYPSNTYTAVANRYNVSATKVQRLFDNHVDIKRKQLPEVLSIDEHYFPNSNYDSKYCLVLMNFDNGEIVDVLSDRKKDFLISYFSDIKNKTLNDKTHISELNNVKYVSIDLWEPYKDIAKTYFPKAKICADSFHVLEHLTKDFTALRCRCRRNTQDENLVYLLTKFKYIFNHDFDLNNEGKYNSRYKRYLNYQDIINICFNAFPELKLAYDLKEAYIVFNETLNNTNIKEELDELINKFKEADINEYREFITLLENWKEEIINSFSIHNNKRINNSYIESINNQIGKLILNANGFVNFKRFRNRVMYCINKNDTFHI